MKILHLGRQTFGDHAFYTRWETLGEVVKDFDKGRDASVLVVDHHLTVTDHLIQHLPNLKWICSPNTCTDHIQITKPIPVLSLEGETEFLQNVRSVSEFTMSLILSLARHLDQPGTLLHGKTVGIIGLGRIGSQVLRLAKAFGMHPLVAELNTSHKDWRLLFSESDFITVHVPLNDETVGLIDEESVDLMKGDACLINTSRGRIVDEHYVIDKLWEGKLGGYATDVLAVKPRHKPTNLLITDHIAGNTLEDRVRTDKFILDKLRSRIRSDDQIIH